MSMADSPIRVLSLSPAFNEDMDISVPLLNQKGTQLEETPPANIIMRTTVPDNKSRDATKERCIETPYGTIHVTTQGDPVKPAIVTYHDIGTNSTTCFNSFLCDVNMVELYEHFYWIHIDAPGQEEGASEFIEGYVYPTINELAEQVGIIVEYFELSYIIGFGVGAGANILTRYAILCPEQVRGLILVNLSPVGISWDNLSYYSNKLVSYLLKKNKLPELVQKYLMTHSFMSHEANQDLAAMYHDNFEHLSSHNLSKFLESYSKRSPIIDQFKQMNCNCLFVFNKGFENAVQLTDLVSNLDHLKNTLLEISESGHLVLEEQPERVAVSVRLFLQGLGHAVTLGVTSSVHSSLHELQLEGNAIAIHP